MNPQHPLPPTDADPGTEPENGSRPRLRFSALPSALAGIPFRESVLEGLSSRPKWLSCSWFYDEVGSALFEEICGLEEYYLTRAEAAILKYSAGEIASWSPGDVTLVELGSGSSTKTRTLIDAFHRRQSCVTYCPIDISAGMLKASAQALLEEFPRLWVDATAADYLEGLRRIQCETSPPRLILFLGSTIGNFTPDEARDFLTEVGRGMWPEDRLLLGVDLRKSPAIIQAAYNDRSGVTAAFNKNLLVRINRELHGNFDLDLFDHQAPYLETEGRVEMRLVSRAAHRVEVDDRSFDFEDGESILTEFCHKYSFLQLNSLAAESGMSIEWSWQDPEGLFSLSLMAPL